MANQLIISTSVELVRIQPEKIVFISSDGNYSTIFLCDGETYYVTMQIGKLADLIEKQLGVMKGIFIRVGRSLIINQSYVYRININQQQLILSDHQQANHTLTASKEALKQLKDYFEKEAMK